MKYNYREVSTEGSEMREVERSRREGKKTPGGRDMPIGTDKT